MHRRANDLFPGFRETRIETSDVDFAVLTKGSGPAILLLHGYPETRTAWHRIAPALADAYTVVVPDLPGYGDSRMRANSHGMGSKRQMAKNLHEMMLALGHQRFVVIGHDRGGRVAIGWRSTLPNPSRLSFLSPSFRHRKCGKVPARLSAWVPGTGS